MDGLIEGRMVHFVIPDHASRSAGEHRAATIVRVWDKERGVVNLHVFFDGANDDAIDPQGDAWVTSVPYAEEPTGRTWHWIEKA